MSAREHDEEREKAWDKTRVDRHTFKISSAEQSPADASANVMG
jgi:hypothetical protein